MAQRPKIKGLSRSKEASLAECQAARKMIPQKRPHTRLELHSEAEQTDYEELPAPAAKRSKRGTPASKRGSKRNAQLLTPASTPQRSTRAQNQETPTRRYSTRVASTPTTYDDGHASSLEQDFDDTDQDIFGPRLTSRTGTAGKDMLPKKVNKALPIKEKRKALSPASFEHESDKEQEQEREREQEGRPLAEDLPGDFMVPVPTNEAPDFDLHNISETERDCYPKKLLPIFMNRLQSVLCGHCQPHLPPQSKNVSLMDHPCLPGMNQYEMPVRKLLHRTIAEGEGNCLIIVGARGVGKTAIVERSLGLLRKEYGENGFLTVRLNALVESTNAGTLKEMARQLCSAEGGLDDDGSAFTTNASTSTTLLSILEPAVDPTHTNQEVLTPKPIILILDEFEQYATREHRQFFLYSLLDIVQSGRRANGFAVIGLSARSDCIELMEKRVKSRCQSRMMLVPQNEDVKEFQNVAAACLRSDISAIIGDLTEEADQSIAKRFCRQWNEGIEILLKRTDIAHIIREVHAFNPDKHTMLTKVAEILAANMEFIMASRYEDFNVQDFYTARASAKRQTSFMSDLTVVEILCLICAKHVAGRDEHFNFAQVAHMHSHYQQRSATALQGHRGKRGPTQAALYKAFNRLHFLGIIQPVSGTIRNRSASLGTFQRFHLLEWPSTIDEGVKARADLSQGLKMFCKNMDASLT